MNKFLLCTLLMSAFAACTSKPPPTDVAKAFIVHVYNGETDKAVTDATQETRVLVEKTTVPLPPVVAAEESFALARLKENIAGDQAEVKNDIIAIQLKKEDGNWKVVASSSALQEITTRDAKLVQLKTALNKLLQEFNGRMKIAKDYVNYKKSLGSLSEKAQKLNSALDAFKSDTVWTKEKLTNYIHSQEQLTKLIEQSLEPSFSAHTDLSMRYFLQMSQAADRIKQAQNKFQSISQEVRSGNYTYLPAIGKN